CPGSGAGRRGAGPGRGRRRRRARRGAGGRRTPAARCPGRGGAGMSARSSTQVARMLERVPYLQRRDGIHVDEVAADFGVPAKQIVADLKALWFCGLPGLLPGDLIEVDVDALDGEGIIRLSNAEFLDRPRRLEPTEALALIVA